jgi:hypothetical protein
VSLEALGKLAEVERSNMLPWVDTLFPSILDSVQDYSSATQQATSFRALGQIAGSTGYVITPYLRYHQLLPLASAVLPGTRRAPWALRREVMRTLGILGAIDPQRYTSVISKSRKRGGWGGGYFVEDEAEMNSSVGSSSIADACVDNRALKQSKKSEQTHRTSGGTEKSILDVTDDDDDEPAHFCMYEQYSCMAQPTSKLSPPQRLCPMNEDFYSTVVIQALTRILKDQSLAVHHGMAMQAIMFTFNSLGIKCVKYLPRVLPHLVQTVRTCNQSALREGLMQQIAKLCNIVKDHLRPYVDSIFSLVEDFWNSRHLPTILQLVEQMSEAVPDYFTNYVPRLISLLLTSLDAPRISEWTFASGQNINVNLSSVSDAKRLELVLHSIRSLKSILSEYLHLLIPSLVKLVETISSTNGTLVERDVNYAGEVIAGGDNTSTVMAFFLANASTSLSQTDVSQQIKPHPNRIVGIAIVETLCVCAVRLGREKWCLFYHSSARAAIQSWQTCVNYSLQDAPSSKDLEDRLQWTCGLSTYDKLIHDIINKNDCSGSNEYMNINEINQQLDRLNHLDDMYDDEGNVSRTMVFES